MRKIFCFHRETALPCPALRPNTSQDTHEDIRMCKINDTPVLYIDPLLYNCVIMYETRPPPGPLVFKPCCLSNGQVSDD